VRVNITMDIAADYFLNPLSSYNYVMDNAKSLSELKNIKSRGVFAKELADKLSQKEDSLEEKSNNKKLLEVCHEMEALLIGVMLKSMRSTIGESDFLGKSMAKDIFRDMLYDEYARMMARTDQLGIGRIIYNQLLVDKKA